MPSSYTAHFGRNAPQRCDELALGVSLGNPNFAGERMPALLDLVERRAERCIFVVGDSLYRLSIVLDRGLDLRAATAAALRAGEDVCARLASAMVGRTTAYRIVTTSELSATASFRAAIEQLVRARGADSRFAAALHRDAVEFLRRGARGPERECTPDRLDACAEYLLEDLAVCTAVVSEFGVRAFAYPGVEPRILREARSGEFAGAPRALRSLSFLSIRLRRQSSADRAEA